MLLRPAQTLVVDCRCFAAFFGIARTWHGPETPNKEDATAPESAPASDPAMSGAGRRSRSELRPKRQSSCKVGRTVTQQSVTVRVTPSTGDLRLVNRCGQSCPFGASSIRRSGAVRGGVRGRSLCGRAPHRGRSDLLSLWGPQLARRHGDRLLRLEPICGMDASSRGRQHADRPDRVPPPRRHRRTPRATLRARDGAPVGSPRLHLRVRPGPAVRVRTVDPHRGWHRGHGLELRGAVRSRPSRGARPLHPAVHGAYRADRGRDRHTCAVHH